MVKSVIKISFLTCGILMGCASATDDLTEKMSGLEKELMQVKAENANLAARIQALDDKLLLLEKKEEVKEEESDEKRMEVIRLSPEAKRTTSGTYDEISLRENGEAPVSVESEQNRPVLQLSAWGDSGEFSGGSAAPAPARRAMTADPIPMTNRGDNLGVVAKNGDMAAAATDFPQMDGSDEMANFHMAYRAYSNKSFDAALAGFATFLKNNPDHEYADNAMYWRGECYLAQGKMLKAIGEFERLIKRYADSDQAASALYRLGFVYDKLQDQPRAKEYYFLVVEKHPGTESARKASRRIAALETENSQAATIATSARR